MTEIPSIEVQKILLKTEKALRRKFLQSIAFTRGQAIADDLEELIEDGRLEEAIALSGGEWEEFARQWADSYTSAAEEAALVVAAFLGMFFIDFDRERGPVSFAVRANRNRLIQGLRESQEELVRSILRQAALEGASARATARSISGSIGLTARQWEAVSSYRALLENGSKSALRRKLRDARFDREIRSAISAGRTLSASAINRMVDRYTDRLRAFRANSIAELEGLRATHQGTSALFDQVVGDGLIRSGQILRTWKTREDSDVRDSHASMEGSTAAHGVPFVSGRGNLLLFPGDPSAPVEDTIHCRCVLSTTLTE